jgi:hypothetical protein
MSVVLVTLFGLSDVNCAKNKGLSAKEQRKDPNFQAKNFIHNYMVFIKKEILKSASSELEKSTAIKILEKGSLYFYQQEIPLEERVRWGRALKELAIRRPNLVKEIIEAAGHYIPIAEKNTDEKVKKAIKALASSLTPPERALLEKFKKDTCSLEIYGLFRILDPTLPPPNAASKENPPVQPNIVSEKPSDNTAGVKVGSGN